MGILAMEPETSIVLAVGGALLPGDAQPPAPDRNPVAVYLASLKRGDSRATMRAALVRALRVWNAAAPDAPDPDPFAFAWWRLGYQHTAALRSALASSGSPASANKVLCAVRQVLHHARRLGLMKADACAAATDVRSVENRRLPAGRALSIDELDRLRVAARGAGRPRDLRDAAMLALMALAGLRCSEATALPVAAYDAAAGVLRVLGKRDKEREVPVADDLAADLAAWLDVRGRVPGPVVCAIEGVGLLRPARGIARQSAYAIAVKAAKRAGMKCSPHDLRRTFITEVIDATGDLSVAADLGGHESTDTTRLYDRRGAKARRKAVDAVQWSKRGSR